MNDLRVLTVECTRKFHKPRMAEYPYSTSSATESPPSNFERPLSWPSRSDGYSDRVSSFQRLIRDATCSTAVNQVESEKSMLYSSLSLEIDYESLTAEHSLNFADYGCEISSMLSLLGDDK